MNAPDEAGNQHALSLRVSEHLMREAISMQLNAPRLRSPCVDEGGNQHAIERTAASLSMREQQVDEQ